jgi:hypothetical protein
MKVLLFVLLVTAVAQAGDVMAAVLPRAPCEDSQAEPAFPALGQPPNIEAFNDVHAGEWTPPPCTSWQGGPIDTLVALAGTFANVRDEDQLLARFGDVSAQSKIRYWSVSRGEWQDLVTKASALASPNLKQTREDFTAAELSLGGNVYFVQDDNRSSVPVVYRMHVQEAEADRLTIEIENVTPIKTFLFTLFRPGQLRTVTMLRRLTDSIWGYYSLTSAKGGMVSRIGGTHTASFINRAVAFYRYTAGIPTDQEPPAMR